MKKHIYRINGDYLRAKFVKTVNAEPECGEDFCDRCGDCLHCYSGDPCYDNNDGEHLWIEYQDSETETEK